jgi:hypothetical protein
MTPDTIVDVYCEICEERIAQVRVGDLQYPMTGGMFLSPDEHHGYPAPFEPSTEWEYMRCPHCRFRPFLQDDRINAGDCFVYARKHDDEEEAHETVDGILQAIGAEETKLQTCDICGKQFTPMQMGLHKNNHRRAEKKKARERGRK